MLDIKMGSQHKSHGSKMSVVSLFGALYATYIKNLSKLMIWYDIKLLRNFRILNSSGKCSL